MLRLLAGRLESRLVIYSSFRFRRHFVIVTRVYLLKLAFEVAATIRKCRRGILITGQLFICLRVVC